MLVLGVCVMLVYGTKVTVDGWQQSRTFLPSTLSNRTVTLVQSSGKLETVHISNTLTHIHSS